MKILNINTDWVGAIVGVLGFALTVLVLYISNMLKDKMKATEHDIEIEHLKQEMREVKDRLNSLRA